VTRPAHPSEILFPGEKPFPAIPACEHYAGNEKLMLKALALQAELGPVFDVTFDCEDGAPAGREREHAELAVRLLNSAENRHRMAGFRIHDPAHPAWRQDVDIMVAGAGAVAAYVTIPKPTGAQKAARVIEHIQAAAARHGVSREIPIHVLIETHGALREVWEIARLPWVQVLDFGLMDFVSGHHGAIPASAIRSPGQFEHPLIVRAKAEIAAAALANGCVPSHNITQDIRDYRAAYEDALRARTEFGYLRMWSIHPVQIEPIVEAMRPDFAEVQAGAEILLAAQAAGWAPVQHEGRLHDRASYRYYWELMQKARVTGVALPEAAERAFFAPRD
jgi:citrate lyase subunit beta/citryl-CoA lyase